MAAQQAVEHAVEAAVKTTARYPHMMSKLTLKNGTTLRNRVIMGSMHTGLEEAHGGRLEKMAAFYAARSAIKAVRADGGVSTPFPFEAPLTVERIQQVRLAPSMVHVKQACQVCQVLYAESSAIWQACLVKPDQFTLS